LWELGDLENAMACCRRAIALDQSHVRAHANLGLLLLSTGDFEHGWRENEWRLALPKGKSQCSRPLPSGASAAGQTILLRAEQGFGDTIQFLRYLPLVRERLQARSVILECPSALARLVLQSDSWDAEIVVAQNGAPYPLASFDHDIPLFSLPVAMERFEPLAMTKPYLWAASELRNRWASRLDRTSTWRVGVAWAGSPNHNRDRQRSIKLEKWRPILSAAGVTFYSLQLGQDATQAQEFRGSGPIDLTGHITDFADTAALLAELDLVVCVDTSIAHLAGAMSKPVWTLLPFVPDWRWGLEREDTPWYPTMRLFRQPKAGDWDSVIQRVAAELRVFCSQPRLGPSFATS
jgi:hypothetical protein